MVFNLSLGRNGLGHGDDHGMKIQAHPVLVGLVAWPLLAVGCGKVEVATQVPAGGSLPAGYRQPTQVAPSTAPVVFPGGGAITPPPASVPVATPLLPMPRLQATLTKFDNGMIFGLVGTKVAYVEIRNSSQVPLRGTLKVQFTDSGVPLADRVQTRQVEVAAGAVQVEQFTDKHWKIDGATVTILDGATSGVTPPQSQVPGMPGGYPGY